MTSVKIVGYSLATKKVHTVDSDGNVIEIDIHHILVKGTATIDGILCDVELTTTSQTDEGILTNHGSHYD